jgi:hypothetical protein
LTFQRESKQKGIQRAKFLLYLLLCLVSLIFLLSLIPVQALSVGEKGTLWRVSAGDTFILRYTHSMYGVEVRENFRIGREEFTLYQVDSTEAALEYFGLEHSGPNNVRRTLKAFAIPAGSVGNHELLLKDGQIQLHALSGEEEPIPILLVRVSLLKYLMHTLRR